MAAALVAVLAAVLLVAGRVGGVASPRLARGASDAALGLRQRGWSRSVYPPGELLPWHWDSLVRTLDEGMDRAQRRVRLSLAQRQRDRSRDPGGADAAAACAGCGARLSSTGSAERPATAALVAALAAFAIPATARPTAAPLIWGLAVLALTAVWLWGPRLRAPLAVGLLCAFGAVGAAAAGALAADEPPIDYRAVESLRDDSGDVSFNWDHTYGPIDWPRRGTPLFEVEADRPGYWRVETLDEFYATVWRRSEGGEATRRQRPRPPAGGLDAVGHLHPVRRQAPAPGGTALDVIRFPFRGSLNRDA